ncbi:response regulator transcription factor [Mesonia sp. K7]|uniref:response regulator n=1 Tax=Mesonia sp. K7 TaxID=2218606 RepID=UPI000DA8C465|nr:response regulator transcription factor [Mesonia sp. K7]PZD79628.1 DNA-binding response regulator [Mesonia sp. K7]
MIRLAIAEDHQALIDGIQLLLQYEENIEIVGFANNGEDLLEIVRKKQPNMVLTDIRMPKIDGIAATKIIKKEFPQTKVIAFTMFDQTDALQQMVAAGASGYLLKNASLTDVKNAIEKVAQGETFFDNHLDLSKLEEESSRTQTAVLSKSETEILKLIGQGKTSNEIADIRFCSVSTVETHRKNMIKKLNLQGKGELLRYALESKYDFK